MDLSGAIGPLALLLFAAAVLPLGEFLRRWLSRWARLLELADPVERGVVDLYLGGAVIYGVAALPFGAFTGFAPEAILLAGAGALGATLVGERARPGARPPRPADWGRLRTLPVLAVLGATALLYVAESAAVGPIGTGNTFDASVLTTFVGLLRLHHQLPTSLAPVALQGLTYPQGTTAWLGAAQDLLGLAPARTSLLVTPLFLSLGPLGAYAWGRRTFDRAAAGAAFGLGFALLVSWTRVLAGGSNDFVFAFPLVLVLFGWLPAWSDARGISLGDAIAFGALAGYSAALNPVGAELLFLLVPVLWLGRAARGRPRPGPYAARAGLALAAALPFVLPSLLGLWQGRSSPGLVAGAGALGPASSGLTGGQLIGLIDPLLFGPTAVWLSPFPLLRLELAALLLAGAGILAIPGFVRTEGERRIRRFALATLVLVVGLLLAESGPLRGVPGLSVIADVTSAAELSVLLFTAYAAVAMVPIVRLLEAGTRPARADAGAPRPAGAPRRRWSLDRRPSDPALRTALLLGAAAIVLLPGLVVTTTALPVYLDDLYGSFGRVSPADLALLSWTAAHLPAGTRVLVAPGSAAEFLPGYDPRLVILYPMTAIAANATYHALVVALDAGRLNGSVLAELDRLAVDAIAVTGNNTALDAPFLPGPFLDHPDQFIERFHDSDAYLFEFRGPADPVAVP